MSLLPQLECDLVAAAGHRHGLRPPDGRLGSRGWRGLAVAAIALLCLAGAAGAATGLWSVGAIVDGAGFSRGDAETVQETVVASGTAPDAGRWRITRFETADGLPCLKLRLVDRPAPAGARARDAGRCAHPGRDGFDALGSGTRAQASAAGHVLLWGIAPRGATKVRLTAAGGETLEVPARRGPDGDPSRYWLLEAPVDLDRPRVAWLAADGEAAGEPLDVAFHFRPPTGRTVVAEGTAPFAGPWRMVDYESERHVSRGDLYEPEGLPCLMLVFERPTIVRASGQCGVLVETPAFMSAGHTVRDPQTRKPLEMLLYGRAPARAEHVEIVKPGLPRLLADARPGPPAIPGRFWLIPVSPDNAGGHVAWTGHGRRGPVREIPPP